MPKEINFLRERQKELSGQEKGDRWLLKVTSMIFGVIFVLFLAAFGTQVYFSNQLTSVQTQEQNARAEIAANQDIEKSFLIFANKISVLTQLFQDRLDKKEAINYFATIFGSDILIREITFDPAEKLLVFRVQASDVFHMLKVFSVINSPDTQSRFASVNASNLERTPDGKYEIDIVVSTKKAGSAATS